MEGIIKLENSLFASPTALIGSGHVNQWMESIMLKAGGALYNRGFRLSLAALNTQ